MKFTESELHHHYQQKVERRLTSLSDQLTTVEPYMFSTDLAKNAIRTCRSARVLLVTTIADGGEETNNSCLLVDNSRLATIISVIQPLSEILGQQQQTSPDDSRSPARM